MFKNQTPNKHEILSVHNGLGQLGPLFQTGNYNKFLFKRYIQVLNDEEHASTERNRKTTLRISYGVNSSFSWPLVQSIISPLRVILPIIKKPEPISLSIKLFKFNNPITLETNQKVFTTSTNVSLSDANHKNKKAGRCRTSICVNFCDRVCTKTSLIRYFRLFEYHSLCL